MVFLATAAQKGALLLLLLIAALVAFFVLHNPLRGTTFLPADEYRVRYLGRFFGSQIEKLDYEYRGMFRGQWTIARIEFKKRSRIQVDSDGVEVGVYDPQQFADETARAEFRDQWKCRSVDPTPTWFDFPFDKPLRMIRAEGPQTADHPASKCVWYIDDERNVVYFWGTSG